MPIGGQNLSKSSLDGIRSMNRVPKGDKKWKCRKSSKVTMTMTETIHRYIVQINSTCCSIGKSILLNEPITLEVPFDIFQGIGCGCRNFHCREKICVNSESINYRVGD